MYISLTANVENQVQSELCVVLGSTKVTEKNTCLSLTDTETKARDRISSV